MTAAVLSPARPTLRPKWRKVEWYGTALALFLTSGAVFPLLMMVQNGELGDAERAQLRLLQLPVFAITLLLMARHPAQLIVALRRSLPLVLLCALALVSTLWSVEPHVTLRRAIGLAMTMMLAYFMAIRFTPRQLLTLVSAVMGLSLGLSLVLAVVSPGVAYMHDGTGLRGVFTHKNVLGWASCLGIILAMGLILECPGRFRWRGPALLLASFSCMLLSGSMSSLFSVTIGLALFCLYSLLARTRGLARGILILLAIEAALIILLVLSEFLVPFLEWMGRDATLTGRIPLWHLVDARIETRPWLGFGYQAFWAPGKQEALAVAGALQWQPPHAHNGYRDLMLNFGYVGLALFAVTVVRAIRQGAALHCAAPKEGWAWMSVIVGVMLTLNLTESNLLVQNDIQSLLFMTAIVMFALRAPGLSGTQDRANRS